MKPRKRKANRTIVKAYAQTMTRALDTIMKVGNAMADDTNFDLSENPHPDLLREMRLSCHELLRHAASIRNIVNGFNQIADEI